MNSNLSIVQVNTRDDAGGAARIARDIHERLLRHGDRSRLVVGLKRSSESAVFRMDNDRYRNPWSRFWLLAERRLEQSSVAFRGKGRLGNLLGDVALPARAVAGQRGLEYFGYPAAWHPEGWSDQASLIHLHNLHGDYFDLRALPMLTARSPTMITLHDAWLLAGHCGHSLDCERWRIGCGACPDLSIPPAIKRDGTMRNWRAKRDVFAASTLYVATPSRWLMEKVEASILAPAVAEARVIPNGVDLEVFRPQDKQRARTALRLPESADILVFAANGGPRNPWKDFSTIEAAAVQASKGTRSPDDLDRDRRSIGQRAGRQGEGRICWLYFGPQRARDLPGRG